MKQEFDTVCKMLQQGEVVALPTETVYGLAASIDHPNAIDKIFRLKNRPNDNPLILHISRLSQLQHYCEDEPYNLMVLAETFWPGPLTVVLKAKLDRVPVNVRAGLETVAIRIPKHPLALKMLEETGPLVMPSANISGRPSATRVEHVEIDFGADFPVLDGGVCNLGTESTVICHRNGRWEVARLGGISAEEIGQILGYEPSVFVKSSSNTPISPGQKYRHYAPAADLVLDQAVLPESIGVILGFNDRKYHKDCKVISLGSSSNAGEAAKNLYHALRTLDEEAVTTAWVDMNFPRAGLWLTVAERLQKASQ